MMNAVKSEKDLFLIYHKPEVSNMEYLWFFKALVYVFHTGGGSVGHKPGPTKVILKEIVAKMGPSTSLKDQNKESGNTARTRYLEILLLNGADNHFYINLKTKLYNEQLINKEA